MRFAVVESNREWTEPTGHHAGFAFESVLVEDVEAEARRRLRSGRVNEWRTREFITGSAMPESVRHFAMQVEFAAKAISRLLPIPDDYDSNVYWPRMPEW